MSVGSFTFFLLEVLHTFPEYAKFFFPSALTLTYVRLLYQRGELRPTMPTTLISLLRLRQKVEFVWVRFQADLSSHLCTCSSLSSQKSNWSWGKVLYILSRYGTLFNQAAGIPCAHSRNHLPFDSLTNILPVWLMINPSFNVSSALALCMLRNRRQFVVVSNSQDFCLFP